MNILFEQIQGNSGSDIWVENLARQLRERGHHVAVEFHPHWMQYFPWCARPLRYDKKPSPDIVCGNSWSAFRFKRDKIPLVVVCHQPVHLSHCRKYKSFLQKIFHDYFVFRFEKRSFELSASVVAVSQHTGAYLRGLFKSSPQIIYNGIDTTRFTNVGRLTCSSDVSRRPFRLLFAGNLSWKKGSDRLSAIMAQLSGEAELRLAAGLQGRSWSGTVPPNVILLGKVDSERMANLYLESDAFLFPARLEGCPLVVAEAMASGLPCIVSDAASMPELIVSEKGGFVCPEDSIDAYVDAIRTLIRNSSLQKSLGDYNRERVRTLFSLEVMAKEYETLFTSIVEESGSEKSIWKV